MRWIRSVVREVLGLFVEDGSFAGAVLLWAALSAGVLPRVAGDARWTGPAFFAGLALILIESLLRFARRRTK